MSQQKSRSDILLEERIAQIDDINFDKIYDVDEFAMKQIEDFEDVQEMDIPTISSSNFEDTVSRDDTLFELEVQPNEFLDNHIWEKDDEDEVMVKKPKFFISNKPLFFTFTSIAFLLCILLVYNVFVINSLNSSLGKSSSALVANTSNIQVVEKENNYIQFENSSKIEIEENNNYLDKGEFNEAKTNWFDAICNFADKLFGG